MKFNEMILGNNNVLVAVMKVEAKEAKNKKVYALLTLGDGTQTIEARMWENPDNLPFQAGEVLDAVIEKSIYSEQESYLLKQWTPSNAAIADLLPHAPIETKEAEELIFQTIAAMKDPVIKKLTKKLIDDNLEKFLTWTAASGMHHNYFKGLLYHTYRMLQSAQALAKVYPVNNDILFAAVILHDLAKIKEYEMSEVGAISVTPDCALYGHLVMGIEMINKAAVSCGFDPDTMENIRMLKHCILAHHGKLEYSSPVVPATKEAMLLHEIDLIDARMWQFENEETKLEPGTMSERVFGLDARVYRADYNNIVM